MMDAQDMACRMIVIDDDIDILDADFPANEDPGRWVDAPQLPPAKALIVDGRLISLSFRNPNVRLQRYRR